MAYFLQQIANAVPVAALYGLLAFGYAIAFGVTRRADIVQGALFAFAGQIFVLGFDVGWNRLWLVLPASLALAAGATVCYAGGAALLVARHVMQPLVRQTPNAIMVAGLGVLIMLMETARIASDTRSLWLPPLFNQTIHLIDTKPFPVTLTAIQIANSLIMAALVLLGHSFISRSSWGRNWRAVRDDLRAAELCGINAAALFVQAYLGASLLAAIAAMLATTYYGTMDFGAGLIFGLKVVMIGALGLNTTPLRAALGGIVLGVAETFWGAYGPLLWRDLVVFAGLVLALILTERERPVP